jgi:hypothetical protein
LCCHKGTRRRSTTTLHHISISISIAISISILISTTGSQSRSQCGVVLP